MKIAILYIGIGGYKVFWKDFYSSCERYFLPNIVKEYFFFTDQLDELKPANVKEYFQEDLGWPGNTLYRFKMFLKYKEELAVFDFIYFFNGNTLFLDTINEEEIIPNGYHGTYMILFQNKNILMKGTVNLLLTYRKKKVFIIIKVV